MAKALTPKQKKEVLALRGKMTVREAKARTGVSEGKVSELWRDAEVAATKQRRPAKAPAVPPSSVDDIPATLPEDLSLDVADRWIPRLEKAMTEAEAEGEFSRLASLTARLTTLLEHRRKAAPLPKTDPNELPDMKAAAARARKMLHDLIETSPEPSPEGA